MTLNITAFWNVSPCSLVEVDQRFRGVYCLHCQGTEMVAYFHETTWRYIPESCHLDTLRHENLKSHVYDLDHEKYPS
jgi:hypothetical protein